MKRIALLLAISAVASCATSEPEQRKFFVNPNLTREQFIQDRASCNFQVSQAMTNYRYDSSTPWAAAMGRSNGYAYSESLFRDCMVSKGWEAREEYTGGTNWHSEAGTVGFLIRLDATKPVILSVHPGSPADRQGMKAGDLITAKNERKITGIDDYKACSPLSAGEMVEYKALRGTEELTFRMQAVRIRDLP